MLAVPVTATARTNAHPLALLVRRLQRWRGSRFVRSFLLGCSIIDVSRSVAAARYPCADTACQLAEAIMQAEHFAEHEDRLPDRGAYADSTNFHAGSMISPGFLSSGGRRSAAEGGSPNSDR
jgi:hypothetical protein